MNAGKACLVLAATLLAGCAGSIPVRVEPPAGNALAPPLPPSPPGPRAPDLFGGIPSKYGALAESAERAGDLRRALLYRKVVNGFSHEGVTAREDIERLERKIRGEVDRHDRTALALLGAGENEKALREFLNVLLLDPDHQAAFHQVKTMMNGKNGAARKASRTWTVREGDTLRKIAGEVYRDPDKEFLISYFNRLSKGSPLSVGAELRLPDVDITSSTPPEKSPGYSRPEKAGNGVRNGAERKDPSERIIREAEAHYDAGMRSFLKEDLDGAIREWEKALSLDPSHPKARRDIEKARRLKGKIDSSR